MAAWANLHDVTSTLTTLLSEYIVNVLEPGFSGLAVTDQLPTTLNGADKTLNLYLYHVREDPSGRNLLPNGADYPPAPYTPLGLELFYLLTAHHSVSADVDAEMQQRLMGYAIKTFHDVALINDATTVFDITANKQIQIMAGGVQGHGNRFEIVPRNPTPEEALSIWTTGNREFTRLAAYYAVRAVFLDPLPATLQPGIVLTLGAHVKPAGVLRLGDTRSSVRFTLPDGSQAATALSPATVFQVPAPNAGPAPHPWPNPDAALEIEMEAAGSDLRLVIANSAWSQLAVPLARVVFEPALNANDDWSLAFRPPGVALQIGDTLSYHDETGAVKQVPMFPGSCVATVESIVSQEVVAGKLRVQVQPSNQAVFTVAPRVLANLVFQDANGFHIAMAPGSAVIAGAGVPSFELTLAVNGQVYTRRTAAGALAKGEFRPSQAFAFPGPPATVCDSIDFVPFANTPTAVDLPVRVSVNGAFAQPFWVRLP